MERIDSLLRILATHLLGKENYDLPTSELFKDINFLRVLISRLLGYGIVCGASSVKLPQLFKIWTARNTYGLSLTAILVETCCYTLTAAYNIYHGNPFSSYGEAVFMSIQDLTILFLMFWFSNNLAGLLYGVLFYGFMILGLSSGIMGSRGFFALQLATGLALSFSRLPQILQNYRQKSTGQLSAITTFALFMGSAARIYTTWTEVQDRLILASFIASCILNFVLVLQLIYYWPNSKHGKAKLRKSFSDKFD